MALDDLQLALLVQAATEETGLEFERTPNFPAVAFSASVPAGWVAPLGRCEGLGDIEHLPSTRLYDLLPVIVHSGYLWVSRAQYKKVTGERPRHYYYKTKHGKLKERLR